MGYVRTLNRQREFSRKYCRAKNYPLQTKRAHFISQQWRNLTNHFNSYWGAQVFTDLPWMLYSTVWRCRWIRPCYEQCLEGRERTHATSLVEWMLIHTNSPKSTVCCSSGMNAIHAVCVCEHAGEKHGWEHIITEWLVWLPYPKLGYLTCSFTSEVTTDQLSISTLNTHMNVPTINCLCHGLQTGRTQWLCHPSREQLTWDARAWFFSQCWKCNTCSVILSTYQGKDTYCLGACEVTDFCSKLQLKHAPAAKKTYINK